LLLSYAFRILGGPNSVASALNGYAEVGSAEVDDATATAAASASRHAMYWSNLPGPDIDLGTLGGANSVATGINSSGQVVGWSNDSSDATHQVAFLWDGENGMQSLNVDGVAYGINDNGFVVGQMASGQAFFYNGHEILPLLSSDSISRATAINDSDVVAGWVETAGNSPPGALGHADAVIWDHGAMTFLGKLPDSSRSEAYAINASGQVVGRSGHLTESGSSFVWTQSHAFLWQQDVGMIDLGTLGDGANTAAYGINSAGDVVGTSGGHAFLYHDGVLMDLNAFNREARPGFTLTAATAINDAGAITGYAQIGGQIEAFLLTPFDDITHTPTAIPSEGLNVVKLDVSLASDLSQDTQSIGVKPIDSITPTATLATPAFPSVISVSAAAPHSPALVPTPMAADVIGSSDRAPNVDGVIDVTSVGAMGVTAQEAGLLNAPDLVIQPTPTPVANDLSPTAAPVVDGVAPTLTALDAVPSPTVTAAPADLSPWPSVISVSLAAPFSSVLVPAPTPVANDLSPTAAPVVDGFTPTPTALHVKPLPAAPASAAGISPTPTVLDASISPTPVANDLSPTAAPVVDGFTPTPTALHVKPLPAAPASAAGISPTPTALDGSISPTPTASDASTAPTPKPVANDLSPTAAPVVDGITPTPTALHVKPLPA
jgi:probable HAF family extracellular repeat protein